MKLNLSEHPHRRRNGLTGEWVLVSPHRNKRPWQGQTEEPPQQKRPAYDPDCYLCPGNERAGGIKNPEYTGTFVFRNDFSALLDDAPGGAIAEHELLQAEASRGICRVICFSPRHDLTLAHMSPEEISGVVEVWQGQYVELGAVDFINYVQIFENKGAMMGCSNPHPHGQIWASENIPVEVEKEEFTQLAYYKKNGRTLLSDYLDVELEAEVRLLFTNEHFVALVPYWATWPYETMIVPRRPMAHMGLLTAPEARGLAEIIQQLTVCYDNLFKVSFPYSMGIHQAHTNGANQNHWHMHFHFYPPLLRSATVKKFMVGYEMLAGPQRDITAEQAAEILRQLPKVHYSRKS